VFQSKFPFPSSPRVPRVPRGFSSLPVYLLIFAVTFALAAVRRPAQANQQPALAAQATPSPQATLTIKPRFSLTTTRTYGSNEKARVYVSYQGINSLDFRLYQINDPFKFFKQLNDYHRMGKEDQQQVAVVAQAVDSKPTFLEKIRSFKKTVNSTVKGYFRSQLRSEARTVFNDKFRSGDSLPLDYAAYASLPFLNQNQMRARWRQTLPDLANEYDTRMIPLDKREPGVYLIEAVNGDLRAYTLAVVTDMTMITKTARDGETLIYAVDRKSGEPRDGAKVQIVRSGRVLAQGTTDKVGLLRTRIPKEAKPQTPPNEADPEEYDDSTKRDDYLIMASRNDGFAISDLSPYYFGWSSDSEGGYSRDAVHYIYTDRPIYRPEQKVYFKGILRHLLAGGGYEKYEARAVDITIKDPNGADLLKQNLPLSQRGTFNGSVDVAASAPLGSYQIEVKINDKSVASGYFSVAEYKKPEYKVKVTTPRQFVPVGEKTKFTVEAKYFFGEPVRGADVSYYIYRSRYYHWWWYGDEGGGDDGLGASNEAEGDGEGESYGYGEDMVNQGQGKLGADGRLEIEFEVPPADSESKWDFSYRLEAQVTDSGRRTIDGKASFVGTRGNVVAYAWPERYVYYQNDNARLKIKTADYEGRPVSAKVTLKFESVKYEKHEREDHYFDYVAIKTPLSEAEVSTNAQGEATYDYKVPVIGSIYVSTIVAEGGKKILSNTDYIYATDRNSGWADMAGRDYDSIKIVTDKKSYRIGEKARILAMLPTDKAHLLVTTELSRVMEIRHIYAEGRAVAFEVEIKENYSPNFYLNISYVKDSQMYDNSKSIAVPARDKFLQIEVIPDKKQYKPRDPAAYTVIARNADGSPASGVEVSLGVVDEAIYSIRPDSSGDIRRAFYSARYSNVTTNFSSQYSFTGYSGKKAMELAQQKRPYQLADFKNENQYAEPTIRKEFKDTAYWQPEAVTGDDGKATIQFNLPDNLTTWRATVRAISADLKVGSKVDRVLSRKDLILRLETPRFLTEGDVVTVSGIVHNYLDADKTTQIELNVTGANLLDQPQKTVTITKQGEQRIDWRISAAQTGPVTLLATAKTNVESDGVELPLNVVPVGLKRTTGGAAALAKESDEQTFSLDLPANANAQARSLRIEAAPSIAGSLFGALDYLTSYPYGCTEQTMSSFLPNVIVSRTLRDVKSASIRATNDLPKKVQRGLDRLYGFQHPDGGWGWWKDDKTDPFMTAYVVDGLVLARRAGFGIEDYRLNLARAKIKGMLDAGKLEDGKPIDPESRAYLVYAYYESGDGDARYLNDTFAKRGELQPYGKALLALTLKLRGDNKAGQVAAELEKSATSSTFDAHWESKRRPMLDFVEEADIEATALAIKALAQIDPESELLPKAARWLVGNRRNGYYWDATKQTAFAIYGLTDYIKLSKELSADYSVEVYLNDEQILAKHITAADAANGQPFVYERKGTALGGANRVRIVKRGKGVLYAASTLDYYTKDENIAPQSTPNLSMTREYLRLVVDEESGQWSIKPLAGELRSGDLIVARLKVKGARGRYLMIEDPIPAGCEQVEQVSGINLNYTDKKWSDWYSSREFRDQRTVLFIDYFSGDSTFQYAMRVQVPGDFKAAPARAEMMYQPTVQANTSNLKLNILDKK
jgi:alpha-2-macroglobulin